MSITSLKYANAEQTLLKVVSDSAEYSAPWPCHTWQALEIQSAIDAGMAIEPWKTDEQVSTEQKESRKQEIFSQLNDIDLQSVRPLRSKINGTSTEADEEKITSLEEKASALRAELVTL